MIDHRKIAFLSASEVQRKLANAEITTEEVYEAIQEQIATNNPEINAFDSLAQDIASVQGGALNGLPISIKDQIKVAGMPCNFGLDKSTNDLAQQTASVIQRLLEAGVSVIGKTNLPPYAMDYQSFNKRTGWTNNPWNTKYTAGGSSGGGAAAVAGGMSYLDIGADLAGSLRIPAAYCGVYSFLPTEGVLESDGMLPKEGALEHFARMGPIVRHVDDLMLVWQVLSGTSPIAKDSGRIKLGIYEPADETVVDERILHAFIKTRNLFEQGGVEVFPNQASCILNDEAYRCYGQVMGYETGELLPFIPRWLGRLMGRSAAKRSPNFLSNVHSGQQLNLTRYKQALEIRDRLINTFDNQFSEFDAILLPVSRVATFKHRVPASDRNGIRDYREPFTIDGYELNYLDALTDFTTPVSLVGNPVVTIPLGLDDRGLPVGAQLVGKRGADWDLLHIAKELDTLLPKVSLEGRE